MAALTSQKVRASYEQVLHVDRDGGGNGATLVSVKDGDNGTTFFKVSTNKISTPGKLQEADYDLIPADFVGHIIGGAAPDGWSEYTSARGRMIVGLPNGGTDEGTLGTALTDLQDKTHRHNQSTTGPDGNGGQSLGVIRSSGMLDTAMFADEGTNSGSNYYIRAGVNTESLSTFLAYIQLMCIKKD